LIFENILADIRHFVLLAMTESSAKKFLGDTQPSVKLFNEHLTFTKNYFWQAESSAKIICQMLSHRQKVYAESSTKNAQHALSACFTAAC
jgi:hypothetical protein